MLLNYLSGLEEDCGNLSVNEILVFATKAARKCMNGRRAEMLRIIAAQREPKTITSVANDISSELHCPKSTVWANLSLLKELGLVKNGRGKPICITGLGRIVLGKVLKADNDDSFIPQADMAVYGEKDEEEEIEKEVDA